MSTLQKWLSGLLGLGALYIVATDPTGIATGIKAATGFVTGTELAATTGK